VAPRRSISIFGRALLIATDAFTLDHDHEYENQILNIFIFSIVTLFTLPKFNAFFNFLAILFLDRAVGGISREQKYTQFFVLCANKRKREANNTRSTYASEQGQQQVAFSWRVM
jgi:hypothetical protein